MEPALGIAEVKQAETYVLAAAMSLARMIGIVMVMPAFTRIGLTGILRSGVALVLALPLVPFIFQEITAAPMDFAQTAATIFKEVFIGITLGIVLGVPIWAAEAAGEILDLQRGLSFADMVDPLSTTSNNITGTFFSIIIVAIYFASGGLDMTLRVAYDSYGWWPLKSFLPVFGEGAGLALLKLLDEIFSIGLMLVIPIVLALLLADLALALVARAAPQLNVFVLSLTVKNLTFAILLVLYGTFMISYMRDDLAWILDVDQRLRSILPRAQ